MNQQEQNGQLGGLESLAELVRLWRQRSEKYSPEFLAATICADLGRRLRLAQADVQDNHLARTDAEGQIREAQELLRGDPRLAECALADVYARGLVEAIRDFVETFARRRLTDEELADEGVRLLFDYDSLDLTLAVLSQSPLSPAARQQRRREQQNLYKAASLVERNPLAFFAVAPMVNGYCLAWNVEEESILTRVARLGSREAEMLWTELNRVPAPVPAVTPECLDENQTALALKGELAASEQETFDHHLKGCAHCRGLLDLLTATFARLPTELPAAPQGALPQALRRPGVGERLRRWFEDIVLEFLVPPQSALLEAYADTRTSERLTELLHRRVLIDTEAAQAVLFVRGGRLYLSLFAENPQAIRSLAITNVRTGKPLPVEKGRPEEKREVSYCLGPVASLVKKTLQVNFHVSGRRYQQKVRIKEA